MWGTEGTLQAQEIAHKSARGCARRFGRGQLAKGQVQPFRGGWPGLGEVGLIATRRNLEVPSEWGRRRQRQKARKRFLAA